MEEMWNSVPVYGKMALLRVLTVVVILGVACKLNLFSFFFFFFYSFKLSKL